MAITRALRVNMTAFEVAPEQDARRYQAVLDMAEYVESVGFTAINVEEHHCTDIGWLSSPLILANAFILHPLAGGVPLEDAWQCLRLFDAIDWGDR